MADNQSQPNDNQDVPAAEKLDSIRKFLGTTDETPPKTETPDTTETPAKADVPDTETETETPEPETPALTQEDIDKEVAQAKLQVFNKIKESFGLSQEEQEQMADEGLIAPWEQEQRAPKSWKEVAEYGASLAQRQQEKQKEEQSKLEQQQAEYQKQQSDRMNQEWDMQLNELRASGKIPQVGKAVMAKIQKGETLTKEERENDPGLKAQADLFQTMYVVSQERTKEGKPSITNMKEIYYEYYEPQKNKPVPGADAPVSGAGVGIEPESEGFKYSDIRGKSFEQIAQEG